MSGFMSCSYGLIIMERSRVTLRAAESVMLAVKLKLPAAVGVPEIVPPADKPKPGGKVPMPETSAHEYGVWPPEPCNWVL